MPLVNVDLTYLSIGILAGLGVLAVLAGTALLLDRADPGEDLLPTFRALLERRPNPEPLIGRILLFASRVRPSHPWSREEPGAPRRIPAPEPPPAEPAEAATVAADPPEPPADPCAEIRAVVEQSTAQAATLRAAADAARQRLAAAQKVLDEHAARQAEAETTAAPATVRRAKDEAQIRYRRARAAARDAVAGEAAAAAWLSTINDLNRAVRDAKRVLAREKSAGRALAQALEKAAAEADGTRLTASRAEENGRTARMLLAACEERERRTPGSGAGAGDADGGSAGPGLPAPPDHAGHGERIMERLLHGDHAAMTWLVTSLAGGDPNERTRWQLLLSDLVDAIVARSIDAVCFSFPERHVLWGALQPPMRTSVAAALAALGFRFDGMGGFADGRIPTQRDLALAVGEAGIPHARIRPWPVDPDLPLLYRNVKVDAAGLVALEAGGLTLGEMLDMLGRRADALAELWNAWGRIRPLLASVGGA